MTVLELVEKYLSLKVNVRHNTQANYNFVKGILKKEPFGSMRIDKVKLSDAKAWLIKLQKDGRGYSTIHSVRGVVRPAFEMAVQDDLVRKNPFGFELATVAQLKAAEGITEELKAADSIAWTQQMNSISARAEEIVKEKLIFT